MAQHTAAPTRTDLEYGDWCTIDGHRYMIIDWTDESVTIFHDGDHLEYSNEYVSDISDYMTTDAEREALGLIY